jgi:hypothetical protein
VTATLSVDGHDDHAIVPGLAVATLAALDGDEHYGRAPMRPGRGASLAALYGDWHDDHALAQSHALVHGPAVAT